MYNPCIIIIIYRGVHNLSARATTAYEEARDKVARFINAKSSREVVWTRNASEAINLVANTWGLAHLKPGDEVILSVAEHHSNLVPWQLAAQKTGAVLKYGDSLCSLFQINVPELSPNSQKPPVSNASDVQFYESMLLSSQVRRPDQGHAGA